MNNETNIVQSKPKTSSKKRAKKAVAFLLVVAILITSAYAFLTAHQTKTNVFTVGNIRLELHEDGWENNPNVNVLNVDGKNVDNSDYITRSKLENIIPGEPITKDPMVKNVGKNDARVYMSVSMPQINGADAFTMNNMGSNWNLFQTVEQNGYKVYYYHYANVLPANSGTDSNTSNLFQSVTLTDEAYSHMSTEADYSIIINAYGCQTVGEDDWQKAWNKIRTSDPSLDLPEIEIITLSYYRDNGELYFEEEKAAGDPIEMKFDSSLAKQNFSFDWVTDNGEIAYEGMIMPQRSLRLNANYTQSTSEEISAGALMYGIGVKNGSPYAYCTGRNNSVPDGNGGFGYSEYSRTTLNIPTEITFSFDEYGESWSCSTGDKIYGIGFDPSPYIQQGIYSVTVPVTEINSVWSEFPTVQSVIIGDGVSILHGTGLDSEDYHTNSITLPYSLTTYEDQSLVGLKELDTLQIPNSVTNVGVNFLAKSVIEHLILPASLSSYPNNNCYSNGDEVSGNLVEYNADHFDNYYIDCGVFNTYKFNGTQASNVTTMRIGNGSRTATSDNEVTIQLAGNATLGWDEGFELDSFGRFSGKDATFNYVLNGTLNYLDITDDMYANSTTINASASGNGNAIINKLNIQPSKSVNTHDYSGVTINELNINDENDVVSIDSNVVSVGFLAGDPESINSIKYVGTNAEFKDLIINYGNRYGIYSESWMNYMNSLINLCNIEYNVTL